MVLVSRRGSNRSMSPKKGVGVAGDNSHPHPRWNRDRHNSARLRPDIKGRPSAATTGIDLMRFSAEDLEEVSILAELKRMTTSTT